jgi:uncharacterized membrane protein YsdA (DUF1294 family)
VANQLLPWTLALYGVASMVCFTFYALDKSAARAGRWRISESTLLMLGLCCGWPGGIVAQHWLRHKSVKASFRTKFWVTVVVNLALLAALAWFMSPFGGR